VVTADDAGADLCVGILGTFGRQIGDAHKIFIPCNVILTFLDHFFSPFRSFTAACRMFEIPRLGRGIFCAIFCFLFFYRLFPGQLPAGLPQVSW
jgi:hypothetical protein